MTELVESLELTEDDQLVDDITKRVVGRLYEEDRIGHSYEAERHRDSSLSDEEIVGARVQQKLYSTHAGNIERRSSKDIEMSLVQDLLGNIEQNPDRLTTEDFALLHDLFETMAKTTDIFENKEPRAVQFANQMLDRYVAATREFILANPANGDLLAADSEESRNGFRVFLAVESAIEGDFETARGMLIDVDGHEQEQPLETILLSRLEEAELESQVQGEKIPVEVSAANIQVLGLQASERSVEEVEQADPHITIGTTFAVLEEMLAPGGRYMTTSEIHIKSAANDLHGSHKERRGSTNPHYNQIRARAEMSLGHSTNPFLPKVIYGALTSDLQEHRGSGFGPVVIHLKPEVTTDSGTTFTYGDSLAATSGGESGRVRQIQLTPQHALIAHAHNIEARERPNKYVEAHVSGLNLEKIGKISVHSYSIELDGLEPVISAAEECIDQGIPTEVILDAQGWNMERRIQDRVDSGMTEEAAIELTVNNIRSNFEQHQDSPLLSLTLMISERSNSYEAVNEELFAKYGVDVRRPKVDGRLLSS